MPLFSELIEQSQGKPIIFNNKTINRAFTITEPLQKLIDAGEIIIKYLK